MDKLVFCLPSDHHVQAMVLSLSDEGHVFRLDSVSALGVDATEEVTDARRLIFDTLFTWPHFKSILEHALFCSVARETMYTV